MFSHVSDRLNSIGLSRGGTCEVDGWPRVASFLLGPASSATGLARHDSGAEKDSRPGRFAWVSKEAYGGTHAV